MKVYILKMYQIARPLIGSVYKNTGILLNRIALILFLTIGCLVFFYTPWRIHGISNFAVLIIGLFLCMLCIALFRLLEKNISFVIFPNDAPNWALSAIILIGISLRIGWVITVPPVMVDDFLVYWNNALNLLESGRYYEIHGEHELRAFRPPGYSYFLALCIAIAGNNPWIPTFTNLIFYILTALVVYSISVPLVGRNAALFAPFLLSIWPSYIGIVGLASTEPLSLFLFTAIFWAFLKSTQDLWQYALLAGVLAGFSALVRASVLMLPLLWILYLIMTTQFDGITIRNTLIAILCMFLVIMPWTIRNYMIFNEFVPISTNGGLVFYGANNPNATGGFNESSLHELSTYKRNEVLWNKTGFALGKQWIVENPLDFFILIFKKQGILLGEDDDGVYRSIYKVYGDNGFAYKALAAQSNLWWVGVWMLAIIGAIRARDYFFKTPQGGLLLWMILFFVAVHSIFESQSRHHIPMIGLLSIICVFSFRSPELKKCDKS